MNLQLFEVALPDCASIFIAARGSDHAAAIVLSLDAAVGHENGSFPIERVDRKLGPDMQLGLADMLAGSATGRAAFDGLFGWCVVEVL